MTTRRSLLFGASLLGLGTYATFLAHDQLTHALIARLADVGLTNPTRVAAICASLLVHIGTGLWILPHALRLTKLGVSGQSLRVTIYTMMAMMFARSSVEASTGVALVGLPFASLAFALTTLAVARNWTAQTRAARTQPDAVDDEPAVAA